jgi:hypothetical protein
VFAAIIWTVSTNPKLTQIACLFSLWETGVRVCKFGAHSFVCLFLGSLFALLPSIVAAAQAKGAQCSVGVVKLQKLSNGVWLIPAAVADSELSNLGLTSNLVLVVEKNRLWLIGSGPSPVVGRQIDCAVKRLLNRKVTDVVNLRPYAEITLGNTVFKAATIWSHDSVAALMKEQCPRCVQRMLARIHTDLDFELNKSAIRLPDKVFMGPSGSLGPFEWWMTLRQPGQPTTVLLHRPSGIAMTSGLVWVQSTPDLRDGEVRSMLLATKALSDWLQAQPPAKQTVMLLPEHGELLPLSALATQTRYWLDLKQSIESALVANIDETQVDELAKSSPFSGLKLFKPRHSLNMQRAWRELEQEWLNQNGQSKP